MSDASQEIVPERTEVIVPSGANELAFGYHSLKIPFGKSTSTHYA